MSQKTAKGTSKTAKSDFQDTASYHLPPLTLEQQSVVDAYCQGRMEEGLFQRHLASDPVLARYVRLKCRPPSDGWLPPASGTPSKSGGH